MEKQRDLSFDFIKGVLIFLVVFGHCLNELHIEHSQGLLDFWINSFHMPLFMFISGWFAWHALDKGIRYTLSNKLKRLALPAFIWSVVILVQRVVMGEPLSLRLLYESCRGIWFLWCLFGLFLMTSLLWNCKQRIMLALCLSCALLILYPWYPNDLLKHFMLPLHFPIFFLGALLGKKNNGRITPPYI